MRATRSAGWGLAQRRSEPLEYPGNHFFYRKPRGINNLCVNALLQRCHATPTISRVALADVLQKGGQISIEPFFYQLFIATISALFSRSRQKHLQHGVREHDGRHIAPLCHQTRGSAKGLLPLLKSLANHGNGCNFRGCGGNRFSADSIGYVLFVQQNAMVLETRWKTASDFSQPLFIV